MLAKFKLLLLRNASSLSADGRMELLNSPRFAISSVKHTRSRDWADLACAATLQLPSSGFNLLHVFAAHGWVEGVRYVATYFSTS